MQRASRRRKCSEPHIRSSILGFLLQEDEHPEYMTLKASEACVWDSWKARGDRGSAQNGSALFKILRSLSPTLTVVVISWVCTCVKNCQIIHLTYILYLLPSFTIKCQEFQIKPEYIMQREKCDLH